MFGRAGRLQQKADWLGAYYYARIETRTGVKPPRSETPHGARTRGGRRL